MRTKLLAIAVIIFFLCFPYTMKAEEKKENDSVYILTLAEFYKHIISNHPVVKQIALISDKAQQDLRIARGLFDPQLNTKFYQKELEGKNYFTLWDNFLKIPTWYGPDVKIGFEQNSGTNVNGENFTPDEGLSYLGLTVPLGQGLLIDERRNTLRQAKIAVQLAEVERLALINKFLLEAGKDYWKWALTYQKMVLYQQGYELASIRWQAVKERIIHGDLPAIDSVEASIEMKNRKVLARQAELDYANMSLTISNYLWKEGAIPLELKENAIPHFTVSNKYYLLKDSLHTLLGYAKKNHPDILKINFKSQQLDLERKFFTDKLKPKLNIEYNFLQKNFFTSSPSLMNDYFLKNYKIGLGFSIPLLLRSERGKIEVTKLKITELAYTLSQTVREIENQVQAAYNHVLAMIDQVTIQKEIVNHSFLLRQAEQDKFENGESSLFLINARESNLISSQIKLAEWESEYGKSLIFIQWAAGKITMPF